jgi:glycolate oxidase iron-sulfur subunit
VQTWLPEALAATAVGQRAGAILRSCVHCGFCNATCPTYQLLGDELDGPRGRIYLVKEMLETEQVSAVTVTHLDRCLTCLSCETTCPSGVAYGELLEIGRDYVEDHYRRGWRDRLVRGWLARVLPNFRAFRRWARLGALAKPFLGPRLRSQLPARRKTEAMALPPPVAVTGQLPDKVLLLDGCVQRVSTPQVNDALEALLEAAGISVLRVADEGCCGGLALHLGRQGEALAAMKRNLDALAPIVAEVDAVLSTASGCGVTWKDYGRHLGDDATYAPQALAVVDKIRDVGEFLAGLDLPWACRGDARRVAVHVPCTLQHGQRCGGYPGELLARAGFELARTAEAHLCCGSAGTYSVLQAELSDALVERKVAALTADDPEVIATANVGCQVHLTSASPLPVVHWVELLTLEGR